MTLGWKFAPRKNVAPADKAPLIKKMKAYFTGMTMTGMFTSQMKNTTIF